MDNKIHSLTKNFNIFYPEPISKLANQVDSLFYFIFILSCILFFGIIFVCIYFYMQYKKNPKINIKERHVTHNNYIEFAWTIIPTVIVMLIFFWGFSDYIKLTIPPGDTIEVRVTGKKWLWEFEYPNGTKTVGELIVPENVPVTLVMSSTDVLHSFYIPNLRVKRDIMPNRYSSLWFKSEKKGNYQIFCTEYCGDGHSNMGAILRVKSIEDYEKWKESGGELGKDLPLKELGKLLYTNKGCNACHSLDGSKMVGPTWKGLYNAERPFTDGTKSKADGNYLRESIVYPMKKIVTGYEPVMPAYAGLLKDREINGIIEYIKSLK